MTIQKQSLKYNHINKNFKYFSTVGNQRKLSDMLSCTPVGHPAGSNCSGLCTRPNPGPRRSGSPAPQRWPLPHLLPIPVQPGTTRGAPAGNLPRPWPASVAPASDTSLTEPKQSSKGMDGIYLGIGTGVLLGYMQKLALASLG